MTTDFPFDVFLSHNSADKPRVRRLAERLRAAGPFQFETRNSEFGIPRLCLSPAALGSDWVGLERSTVLFRDSANAGRRFIPLLLAGCKLRDTLRRFDPWPTWWGCMLKRPKAQGQSEFASDALGQLSREFPSPERAAEIPGARRRHASRFHLRSEPNCNEKWPC